MPIHRLHRGASFSTTPKNLLVWTIGGTLGFLLLIAFTDMLLCGIEEAIRPEMLCSRCAFDVAWPLRTSAAGRETSTSFVAPNRTCPGCCRRWSDYNPHYWEWLRDPIRDQFGRLEF